MQIEPQSPPSSSESTDIDGKILYTGLATYVVAYHKFDDKLHRAVWNIWWTPDQAMLLLYFAINPNQFNISQNIQCLSCWFILILVSRYHLTLFSATLITSLSVNLCWTSIGIALSTSNSMNFCLNWNNVLYDIHSANKIAYSFRSILRKNYQTVWITELSIQRNHRSKNTCKVKMWVHHTL